MQRRSQTNTWAEMQKNAVAGCMDAQKLAFDCACSMARCQSAMMLQAVDDAIDFSEVLSGLGDQLRPHSMHAEQAQDAYIRAINSWLDLTARIGETGSRSASIFKQNEDVRELKTAIRKNEPRTVKARKSAAQLN